MLGTPETPMPQVRPLMPPPLFDAAQAPGTSAAQAAEQQFHIGLQQTQQPLLPWMIYRQDRNCCRTDTVNV